MGTSEKCKRWLIRETTCAFPDLHSLICFVRPLLPRKPWKHLFWSTTNCLLLPGSGWAMLQTLSQNCGFFIPLSLVVHCFYSLNSLFFDLLEDHHPAPKQTHGALSLLINV